MLSSIPGLGDHHVRVVQEWAAAIPAVRRVWAFGSRATGAHNAGSDLDLAIELFGEDEEDRLLRWCDHGGAWADGLRPHLPMNIDLQILRSDDERVGPAVADHGVMIFDRPIGEITDLLRMLSEWASADGIRLYLFGSRVRGDHRPDSDVDVFISWGPEVGNEATAWWESENANSWAGVRDGLPGPIEVLHPDDLQMVDRVRRAPVVERRGKVRAVYLPPKAAIILS